MRHLGIADPSTAFDYSAVDEFLSRGKKIHAIKAHRELDPLARLQEAKDAVEARERGTLTHPGYTPSLFQFRKRLGGDYFETVRPVELNPG